MYLGYWRRKEAEKFCLMASTANGTFYKLSHFAGKEEAIAEGESRAAKRNREMQVYLGSDRIIARILPGYTLECFYDS